MQKLLFTPQNRVSPGGDCPVKTKRKPKHPTSVGITLSVSRYTGIITQTPQ